MNAAPLDRSAQWKKVEEAENKGLPKTAIEEIEPIITSAMSEKVYDEAIKAIAKKIALEGIIQGNKPEEKVTRMEAEIAKAPPEMKPTMEAILANWYWHYFQQNKWRFVRRTATAAAPGKDFTTWDLTRLFAEIDKHFTAALAAEKKLKATPVSAFDHLLQKGTLPDSYRPTMWDFLAYDALDFYTSAEQAGAKAQDFFQIDAKSPALGTTEEFLKWKPKTTDQESPTLKAVKLLQNLLKFHKNDTDSSAFLDADLQRLERMYNLAVGEEKAKRYKAALRSFADTNAKHELGVLALYNLAQVVNGEENFVEARELAQSAVTRNPESRGGKMAYNLIQQIESKTVQFITEQAWADPLPPIRVTYRNINKVHFRLYKADWTERLIPGRYRPEYLHADGRTDERETFLRQKPVATFSADLPATSDFKTASHDVTPPKDLPAGFYFLFASPDPMFQSKTQPIFVSDVWVSKLALVMRQEYGSGEVGGFVLDSKSGSPITGAKIQTWFRNNNNRGFVAGPQTTTDQNGLFNVQGGNPNENFLLLASHEGDQLAANHDFNLRKYNSNPRPQGQTVIFTDRSIYRPGQTIHYKGICLMADQNADNYTTLPDRPVTILFRDVNSQEIATHATKTNGYGSFSGSFTAPRDRLTGVMSLQTQADVPGYAQVSVEEYKRPKFQVELEKPKTASKLDSEVKLMGKATAYTGAAIGGAKVRYRVVREVRYPAWCYEFYWWRMPRNPAPAQEIAHGEALTNADGTFPISFVAQPDLTVDPKTEPVFRFSVTADVTDIDGETRSDTQTVQVGYTALQATITTGSWLTAQQETTITIKTTTLDEEPQAASGTLKIHALKQPDHVQRADILDRQGGGRFPMPIRKAAAADAEPKPDPAKPNTWELGEVVATLAFDTDAKGTATLKAQLPAGIYRIVAETKDKFKKPVTAREQITVLDPDAKNFKVKIPNIVAAPKWTLEPGETFTAFWGTGYDQGRAFVEIEHRGKILKSYWTEAGRTQSPISQKIAEGMRGGFTLRITYVREKRAYIENRHVNVPWTNKQLTVKWEHFVSKLEPGKKETWTAVISGPDAKSAVAEMVAAMYDASLDQYKPHDWMHQFSVFRQDYSRMNTYLDDPVKHLNNFGHWWQTPHKSVEEAAYRSFPHELTANLWGYQYLQRRGVMMMKSEGLVLPAPAPEAAMASPPAPGGGLGGGAADANGMANADKQLRRANGQDRDEKTKDAAPQNDAETGNSTGNLDKVAARSNLNETAFFFPHLMADENGIVKLEFTMPEALTEWKFLGFAHDPKLRSGFLGGETVTAKDLMVQPNPPRFLREGDELEFTVKVVNQSDEKQTGTVRLTFNDARSGKSVDSLLGLKNVDQAFEVEPKESSVYAWRLKVPDGLGPVTYKAVGAAAKLSDGEEGMLPVLTKRILVTESLPLPIRGPAVKTYDFTKLLNSGKSKSIQNQSLTVQVTSNPAWYAVMALPYLMEYPYECSEQTFNRLYANVLARHIATSDPKIKAIFKQWENTPALDSPLEKNQDLKSVLLQETPWVTDAKKESEARRNVGILFDENRLNDETSRLLRKLADMQHPDGRWPWFPGGPGNDYITLYITTGFGRLRHLGVKVDVAAAIKAVTALDAWADKTYRDIKERDPEKSYLSSTMALYLYGRSFFLGDHPVAPNHQEAVSFWLDQAKRHWLKLANRQSQAHLAIGLKRFDVKETPTAILKSIKERSVSNEELGMFWRETELSWWWYHAPIETQAMMIEAFSEVANDPVAVEDCKVWLLKQKQTQNWKTTKATADAVYALLLRGTSQLTSDSLVTVTLGDLAVQPDKVEAGTGFYEQRFTKGEIKPAMGKVTIAKVDEGVAWGSVHWQYLEDISKVTPHEGTPLKLEKKLYKRVFTKKGPVLEALNGPASVGDEIVVRVVLRTDRDMEYVHLKDHRGSGTEPTNVLSKYKYQDGLGYYESTKDTATHFFMDYLPKGTYVFEYAVRAVHKGKYPSGLADIQCMYAPEFNSHSESIMIEVK